MASTSPLSRMKSMAGVVWNSQFMAWLSFFAIWSLFEVAQGAQPQGYSWQSIRPTAEVPIFLAIYLVSFIERFGLQRCKRGLRWGLLGASIVLFIYRLDGTGWRFLMRSEPLLYDQMVMVRHTLVLASDLWDSYVAMALVGICLCIGGLSYVIALLLGRFRRVLLSQSSPGPGLLLLCIVLSLVAATLLPKTKNAQAKVNWISLDFARNMRKSGKVFVRLKNRIEESPYREFEKIVLNDRPSIDLFLVESYGRMLSDDKQLSGRWYRWLDDMRITTEEAGFGVVSAFSKAPVSGGRSWIAEGAIIMGTDVRYEVVFRDLLKEIDRIPHLVRFLNQQGYSTLLLAPADRVRLGVEKDNPYGYDHYISFDDIGYQGHEFGWGRIPDHFSLRYVQRNFLDAAAVPQFLNFHMVSSHAPWGDLPVFLTRAEEESRAPADGAPERVAAAPLKTKDVEFVNRFNRLKRNSKHKFHYQAKKNSLALDAYGDAIEYDLKLIADYLAQQKGDRITIVMGDHQPPVVTKRGASFDVPIHIFSNNPDLLDEFLDYGFTEGILPIEKGAATVNHATLLSLMVRTLAHCCSDSQTPPDVVVGGVSLGE